MKAVGDDRYGPGGVSEADLDERDSEVEDEDAIEDADDLGVTVSQREMQNSRCKMQTLRRLVDRVCILNFARLNYGSQKMCAVGIGHHRSCTFPMMYFFGTNPQCRLSELLFRWSPITK